MTNFKLAYSRINVEKDNWALTLIKQTTKMQPAKDTYSTNIEGRGSFSQKINQSFHASL